MIRGRPVVLVPGDEEGGPTGSVRTARHNAFDEDREPAITDRDRAVMCVVAEIGRHEDESAADLELAIRNVVPCTTLEAGEVRRRVVPDGVRVAVDGVAV